MSHPVTYERLLAFAGGRLGDQEMADVEAHLTTCPSCRRTVDRYQTIRDAVRDGFDEPPPETVLRAHAIHASESPRRRTDPTWLERVVAKLAFDSRQGLALAGVRGPGETIELAFESPAGQVDVQLFPPAGNASEWRLIGQVSESGAAPADAEIARGEQVIARVELDEDGIFECDLTSGPHEVRLRWGDRILVLPGIDVP